MDDFELLKMAAKAAGRKLHVSQSCVGLLMEDHTFWSPLEDDGDALRLAVSLHLDICFYRGYEEVGVQGEGTPDTPTSLGEAVEANEPFGDDIQKATRRAIVRAAAFIGRSMP